MFFLARHERKNKQFWTTRLDLLVRIIHHFVSCHLFFISIFYLYNSSRYILLSYKQQLKTCSKRWAPLFSILNKFLIKILILLQKMLQVRKEKSVRVKKLFGTSKRGRNIQNITKLSAYSAFHLKRIFRTVHKETLRSQK